MNTSDHTVCAELEIALVAPDDVIVPLTISVHYSAHDPYAVRMVFDVGTGETNEWTFARELFAQGLRTCAGVGDVQVWPSGAANGTVNVQLSAPTGSARIKAPAAEVAAFLEQTYRLVDLGGESSALDIDEELSDLLRAA